MGEVSDAPPVIGPRFRGATSRAHVSFTADELEAFAGYRAALRAWKRAQADERRIIDENRSAVAVEAAWRSSDAAQLALSKAKATMDATLTEE